MKKLLLLFLAILLLCAGGLVTWQYWHKHSTKKNAATIHTKNASVPRTQPKTDPSEDGKYLVIKEWGVRFPLPEDLKHDGSYSLTEESSSIRIDSKRISEIPSCSGGFIATLIRAKPNEIIWEDPADGTSITPLQYNAKNPSDQLLKVNQYYYLLSMPPMGCVDVDNANYSENQATYNSVRHTYRDAYKTLESITNI